MSEANVDPLQPPGGSRADTAPTRGGGGAGVGLRSRQIRPEDTAELDSQVRAFVDAVSSLDEQDPKFKECLDRVHTMGNKDVELSSNVSNRMLERPVRDMKSGLFDSGSDISKSLIDLRNTVEKLDPARQGDLFAPRKLLGLIPFGNRLVQYFDEYQSSQTHINAIVESLRRGKDELCAITPRSSRRR